MIQILLVGYGYGERSYSPLGEVPASSVSYCGGFAEKYPELLRADSRILWGLINPQAHPSDFKDGAS